jgi:hypothetical protein
VQLAPGRFERWAEAVVAAIAEAPFAELAGVVEAPVGSPGAPDRRSRLRRALFRAYARADRRVFADDDDPLAPAARPPAADPGALGALDVVVALGRPEAVDPRLTGARHGVWSLRVGAARTPTDEALLFWEHRDGDASVAVRLELGAADQATPHTLECAWTAIDAVSLQRSRAAACDKPATLVRRALHRLHHEGTAALDGGPPPAPEPTRGHPPARTLARHAARVAAGVLGRRLQGAVSREAWYVAYRPRAPDAGAGLPSAASRPWTPLRAPLDHVYADPFLIEREGRHWLFLEDYSYRAGKAGIACVELTPDGPRGVPETVLEEDGHLSYPFVFEADGAMYLLPESSASGRIALYRAHDFPRGWALEHVLVPATRAMDPTLLRHDGRYWLFAAVQAPGSLFADDLCIWWASALAGPWRAHPLNPVVSDVRRARPAGAFLTGDAGLIRPGQDCSRGYGHAITLSRVEVLSTRDYRERPVGRIEPDWGPGVLATHSYNRDAGYEVIDANRRLPMLRRPGARPRH